MNTLQTLVATLSLSTLISCNSQNNELIPPVLKDTETATINNNDAARGEPTEVMMFEDDRGLYSYQVLITGEDIEIVYTYGSHEPITEIGKFKDNKIVVNGCDNCYQLNGDSFCVLNPETDGKDCYSINKDKSYTVHN